MAKLRHIAMQVPDLETAAAFYERCFDMKRVDKVSAPIGDAVVLSDGIMNLTLLKFPDGAKGMVNGPTWAGLHHFGFVVDDLDASQRKVEAEGGQFFMKLPAFPGVHAESKFKDPNGVVFDMSEDDWQQAT